MDLKYYIALAGNLLVFFGISKLVFDEVYKATHIVIDELFHIPQGMAYCEGNFTAWDPKITTLPGLYLVSAAFLGTYFPCNTYNLRFVNVVGSCINLLLFASILKYVYGSANYMKTMMQALNLAILPPLFFFSYVYYTDTWSLTFLLLFSRLCFTNNSKFFTLIFGICSVLMRQTNIAWIAMVFGHKLLDIFIKSSRVFGNTNLTKVKLSKNSLIGQDVDASKLKRYYGFADFYVALKYHLSTFFLTFFKFITMSDFCILATHGTILVLFMCFVYVNGSIVVGDKEAHEATLHVPQLFYFLLFYGVFAMPYVFLKIPATLGLIRRNKFRILLLTIIITAIVHFNTVVHPYLLADNRHYTFYIWNRWFGRYAFAKYAMVPAYIFLLCNLYENLRYQNCISFLLPFSFCLILVLCLQKMIEVRYYLVPYIILRLRFVRPHTLLVATEFLWYIFINIATFYVFLTKEIMWKDFDYAQRIIW